MIDWMGWNGIDGSWVAIHNVWFPDSHGVLAREKRVVLLTLVSIAFSYYFYYSM
jgi:hypothetical protein